MPVDQLNFTKLFVVSSLFWLSLPLFAADKNLTDDLQTLTQYNACERLLDADLSGHFVATKTFSVDGQEHSYSQLVQLRRLGHTSAYTINLASMDLSATGLRELHFVRTSPGWRIGDPGRPQAEVNLMTIFRDNDRILFRFEDASDRDGFGYDAAPIEEGTPVHGDILSPNQLNLRFHTAFDATVSFTRVRLDRPFEQTVSQALKSVLATKLEPDSDQRMNYLIMVQMKAPLLTEEAAQLLGTNDVYPLDAASGGNSNGPFYRFAVPTHVYKLLESIGHWTRTWQVAHIDALPSHMVSQELGRHIAAHVQMQRTAGQQAAPEAAAAPTPPPPPRASPQPAADREPLEPGEAISMLRTLGAQGSEQSRPHRVEGDDHHPRDLDESRPTHEHDNDEGPR